jgi:hypothetical protein
VRAVRQEGGEADCIVTNLAAAFDLIEAAPLVSGLGQPAQHTKPKEAAGPYV